MYKRNLPNLLPYLFSALFFFSPTCNSGGQFQNIATAIEDQLPTRRELRNVLREKRAITVIYPSNKKYEAFYQKRVEVLNNNKRLDLTVTGIKETDFKKEELTNEILFIIGNVDSNSVIKEFQGLLPVELKQQSFTFDKKKYTDTNALFKLFLYPNPLQPSLPIYLITGNDDNAIYEFLKENYSEDWSRMLWSSWGYEVYHNKELKVSGYLSETNWELDKRIHFDFTSQNDTILQTIHFQFIAHNSPISKKQINEIAEKCEMTYSSIIDFIGMQVDLPKISYHFYSSVEDKGLQRDNMEEATANIQENRIEVVMNENFQGSNLHQENKLLLRKTLGKPQIMALEEGLSNHFTQKWQKKGYLHWCKKLYHSDNLPPLEELLDNDSFEKESYLVMGVMSGVFTDFLIKKFGKTLFVKKYRHWQTNELLKLKRDWKEYLSMQFPKEEKIVTKDKLPYLKGFNFAHEGYRVYNGYGSQLAKESLQKIERLGSNAIAIVPYSFMRNPKKPSYIPIAHSAGGENDQSVLFSHYEAQKMGMSTMLKPQIWVGRSWPGDIEMQSEKEWEEFFDYYYRWVRHYALLAEINGFDSYCIGVEFATATLAKEQEWRNIIHKLRGIYSGPLTYAANWGEEFENLKFWDELDFIGLNCYYPLSKKDNPTKKELNNEFDKIMDRIEGICKKYNKQLVFTEIGFRSVENTWKNPHEEINGRSYNDHNQKLCYEVIFEGIKNKNWCNGILWWKWPSYLTHRRNQNKGFTPSQKQTEGVINKYFKTKIN